MTRAARPIEISLENDSSFSFFFFFFFFEKERESVPNFKSMIPDSSADTR